MPIFPSSLMKLWDKWELRAMVLLSLSLQILLILLACRRKYRSWVGIVTWLAYLSADWVSAVSIGFLMNQEDCEDKSSPRWARHHYSIFFRRQRVMAKTFPGSSDPVWGSIVRLP